MILSRWFRWYAPQFGRIATVLLAVAGYLLAVTGIPVPVTQEKNRSEPFPCMDRPCGCKSARQCWKSCCCTTHAERLAWAKSHGIEPPAELAATAAADPPETGKPHRACCTAKHEHAAEGQSDEDCLADRIESSEEPEKESVAFVVISAMRHCNGLAPLWSFLAAALTPPEGARYQFDWSVTGWLDLVSEDVSTLGFSPAPPPPRA
jgi:hypothetical protein